MVWNECTGKYLIIYNFINVIISINLTLQNSYKYWQMTCNAKCTVTSINPKWPGSMHDSTIFMRSEVYNDINSMRPRSFFLGDKGYSCLPSLITPFREPIILGSVEERYS